METVEQNEDPVASMEIETPEDDHGFEEPVGGETVDDADTLSEELSEEAVSTRKISRDEQERRRQDTEIANANQARQRRQGHVPTHTVKDEDESTEETLDEPSPEV